MAIELTETLLAQIAGWDAVKSARSLLAGDKVLSSNWTPPLLKGVVQEGSTSYRAGLVLKSERDIENICTCRQSREWGAICAHSVAVGLRVIKGAAAATASVTNETAVAPLGAKPASSPRPPATGKRLERAMSGAGEPAEIFVILPPNLAPALERGKVMLCFEGAWRGGRSPLNAMPRGKAFSFSEQDAALLDHLELLAGGDTPAMMMIGTKDFAELLPALAGHPRVTLGKASPVAVSKTPWAPPVRATLESNGEITLTLMKLSAPPVLVEKVWAFANQTFQPVSLPESCWDLFRVPVRLARALVPQFLSRDWPRLQASGAVEANFQIDDFALEPQPPQFLLHLIGGLARLEAQLQCAYGPRIMTLGVTSEEEGLWLPDPVSPTRYSTRDLAAERAALGRLLRVGFNGPGLHGRYLLTGQDRVLNFFARELPKWQREWRVTLEERLERSAKQNVERIEPRFEITSSGVQWFDLSVAYEATGGERLTAAEIQRLLLSGQSTTRLRNGKLAVIDTGAVEELQEVLLDCAPQQHEGRYRLAHTQSGFIEATLREQGWKAEAPSAWRERAMMQAGETKLACPPLGELEDVLRSYQKHGVAWLRFLRENGFGGILADEMGLGKTLQVLAGLNGDRRDACPTLVVCPTSLVFNWVAEAQKFTPRLCVLALQGPERHALFPRIAESDLVVTSYALVRRDLERLREFEFDTVVLDEAQHIKNRQTQNAQAVKALRSKHRLVLTGTPLENSVLDLWSIFDFLMPGYLGSAKDFRERYELPITREKSAEAQSRLARRLRPFLLRRLKRDVAKELPPKLEQVSFCELTEEQRAVYQQLMEAGRSEVLAADPTSGKGRMVALNALLRLRQACCDLRLLKLGRSVGVMERWSVDNEQHSNTPSLHHSAAAPSGKLDLFAELLEEVLDGGHRVLVFSQFVSMLTLLREHLTGEGVEFCYLDGSTTDRGAVVTRFQQSQVPVFLISLKAGGVGLNLSGADTVIHFDPWWNPAVEDQATDRAHRLGQTRVVTSYKLITRGTVEEKILQLQARKREIIAATLGGEEQFVEALTWDEIRELFAG
ncbi:MAG: SNF2 helicase associated domain-containing protein [Verrucomicrobia bacterium]|nr:SNF2 helicase associated domain-containing protein [Verrucomicrobiota bacterium]